MICCNLIVSNQSNPNGFVQPFTMNSKCKFINKIIISDANTVTMALQLYAAGTDTTATALKWALLFMCLYPEVKEKVQEEIDSQIGE